MLAPVGLLEGGAKLEERNPNWLKKKAQTVGLSLRKDLSRVCL